MTYAHHYEKHLLFYVGLSFDPDQDYTIETDCLINDLIHYRGRRGAIKAIKAVIELVSRRVIHGHPDRVESRRQTTYLAWLRSVRERLSRPSAPMSASPLYGPHRPSQRHLPYVEENGQRSEKACQILRQNGQCMVQ